MTQAAIPPMEDAPDAQYPSATAGAFSAWHDYAGGSVVDFSDMDLRPDVLAAQAEVRPAGEIAEFRSQAAQRRLQETIDPNLVAGLVHTAKVITALNATMRAIGTPSEHKGDLGGAETVAETRPDLEPQAQRVTHPQTLPVAQPRSGETETPELRHPQAHEMPLVMQPDSPEAVERAKRIGRSASRLQLAMGPSPAATGIRPERRDSPVILDREGVTAARALQRELAAGKR